MRNSVGPGRKTLVMEFWNRVGRSLQGDLACCMALLADEVFARRSAVADGASEAGPSSGKRAAISNARVVRGHPERCRARFGTLADALQVAFNAPKPCIP